MSAATQPPRRNNIFKQLMTLHWWMAMLYVVLFASGLSLERIPNDVSIHDLFYAGHKSFGVLVILLLGWRLLLLVRVWGRKYHKHLPKFTKNWYFKTGLHTLLYVMMWSVPLSGYWLSNSYQANNISLFGLPMPDLFPVNSDVVSFASDTHGYTSKIFALLIVIHFIAQYKVVKANWHRLSNWLTRARASG